MQRRKLVAVLCGLSIQLISTQNQASAQVDANVEVDNQKVNIGAKDPFLEIGVDINKVCGSNGSGCDTSYTFATDLHTPVQGAPECGVATHHHTCTVFIKGSFDRTKPSIQGTLWAALYQAVKNSQSATSLHYTGSYSQCDETNGRVTRCRTYCTSNQRQADHPAQDFTDWTIPSEMIVTALEHKEDANGYHPQLGQMSYTMTCQAFPSNGCPTWLPILGQWLNVFPNPLSNSTGSLIQAACTTVDATSSAVAKLGAERVAKLQAGRVEATHQDGQTGRCLDSNEQGSVYTMGCNAGNYQNWRTQGQTFVDAQTGRCLDSNEQGSVYTGACNAGNYQNWARQGQTFVDVQTGRCLDSNEQGSVYTMGCNAGNYQNWK